MSSLFYLNKYLLKYKWYLILGILTIIISNIFFVMMPDIVKTAIDDIIAYTQNNVNHLTKSDILNLALKGAGIYILLSLAKGFFLFLTRQTIIKMSRFIEFDLKNEIYQQYQKLSFNFYKENATGDLMNRISEDVSKVRMYLGPGIMYTINLVILFTILLYKMLETNVTLTIYVLLPLPIMSILIYFVSSVINKKSTMLQKKQSELSTIVQENFSGIRIIKSYIKEEEAKIKFNKATNDYKSQSISLAKTNAFFMPTIILLIGLSTVITIYLGIKLNLAGEITTGEIVKFVFYVNMLTWPFASVGWVTSVIQRAAASQARINEFLKQQSEINTPSNLPFEFKNKIEFKNVALTYTNSGTTALSNVSFSVNKGKTIGVIGKTGSGKSSLAYLLLRLLDPTNGSVLINGKNLKTINLDEWRKIIGYVPQEHFLFSDTIKNNIIFGLKDEKVADEVIIQAAKSAGIHETIINFPNGYDTILGERGINLSGGQKQRISIARALIKQPQLLILDDCLSAVDNETEELILNAIKSTAINDKDKTLFIISHRISSIKYADKIIVLDKGIIAEEGTHNELMKRKQLYFEIYEKQRLSDEGK
ncbi:MAG TPA: ABC transporter ATP-binding protein [Crocinitomix sp.]|nr:ABC transporter ATP-binding protein [Crocinitomix sp.]